ncbi:maleylacetate reductase [Alkalilacustris brevis]|uniref:maleylacetate reductase n=1 Tax=Alkalilacustris brevis TaxID=2026338 RepID=UPI0013905A1C|nr:maleylacetate reductase [Alkalilacustris brevis]
MSDQAAFVFKGIPARVVFGSGTLVQAGDELDRLNRKKALVLSTPEQADAAEALAAQLGPRAAGVFAGARMHTPLAVTEAAIERFGAAGADCIVALGGGSTIGLGKAIATRTGADQIAIPTTYAGSEMTDILGETAEGQKVTRRDPSILPETVIYDVDLTLSLPVPLSICSALNAIAHAAEALYAPDRNPVVSLLAADAVRAFHRALPVLSHDPANAGARSDALYGAWLCGIALGQTSMGLHHKLCHILGGSFDLPHAETHSILLPHTVGYNAPAVPEMLRPLAEVFDAQPGKGLWQFARDIGAPLKLADLGMAEDDLDRAADLAVANPYANPRPIERDAIRKMLQNAWEGAPPA